ncbi:MAG: nitroreductase/quinone reductase family protein [Thermomicrobiales bacterium]
MGMQDWFYAGGRPNAVARALNRLTNRMVRAGIAPSSLVTLEVIGRASGKPIRFPLVVVSLDGERFLVSMLGPDVNWVRNIQASGGKAVLHQDRDEEVILVEVPVDERAPVLRAYTVVATTGRSHLPVAPDAPIAEFARIAPDFPVFRIVPGSGRSDEAEAQTQVTMM